MSKNLIGKDENLNTVQPDFVTGSESLADLIKIGSCPIETLNVKFILFYFCCIINNLCYLSVALEYDSIGRRRSTMRCNSGQSIFNAFGFIV